jgi:hypothetical protein
MIEGKLEWAGFDGKYFKAVIIKDDGSEWKRDVPVVGVQTKAMQFTGKRVIAEEKKNENNKYFHISDIKLVEVSKPAPTDGKDAVERAYQGRKYTEDQVGLQKCRCSTISSACLLFQGNKTVTVDHILAAAKAFEKYVYEPTLIDEAKKLGAEEIPF